MSMSYGSCFATALTAVVLTPLAAAQLTLVSNLPGAFVDISATGTPLGLGDDATVAIATTLGNALFPAGNVQVGSNGGVRFRGTSTALAYTNGGIPAGGAWGGDQALLPFWDDVNTQGGLFGEIYWQELNGMLVVQWHDVEFFASPGQGTARFQVQVPSTGTTWARFVYADVMQPRPNSGGSATIGYQASGHGNDIEHSFNLAGAVVDGTVLSLIGPYTPPPPLPAVNIVDNIPGTWVDIAGTGTALSLADDAEVDINTTVGNALFAAGVVRVGSNGGIRFAGAGQNLGIVNGVLPSGDAFSSTSQVLLPFWDDIDTENGLWGEIYWQEIAGKLIIQWEATAFYNGSATQDTVTFQVQVNSSGSPLAQFLYEDVSSARANGGASATIGVQGGIVTESFQWSFDTPGAVSDGDVLTVLAGPIGVGSNYCSPNPNSTGLASRMSGSGSASVGSNDLTLHAAGLPLNAFGFFLTSRIQGTTPNPGGSQGVLCLGSPIGRYVGAGQIKNSGATGEIALLLNLTQTPTPTGLVAVVAGDTWNFQAWHRDAITGQATSNFTDGLSVLFTQ